MKDDIDAIRAYKCPVCGVIYAGYTEACECRAKHEDIQRITPVYRPKEDYPDTVEVLFFNGKIIRYHQIMTEYEA